MSIYGKLIVTILMVAVFPAMSLHNPKYEELSKKILIGLLSVFAFLGILEVWL